MCLDSICLNRLVFLVVTCPQSVHWNSDFPIVRILDLTSSSIMPEITWNSEETISYFIWFCFNILQSLISFEKYTGSFKNSPVPHYSCGILICGALMHFWRNKTFHREDMSSHQFPRAWPQHAHTILSWIWIAIHKWHTAKPLCLSSAFETQLPDQLPLHQLEGGKKTLYMLWKNSFKIIIPLGGQSKSSLG